MVVRAFGVRAGVRLIPRLLRLACLALFVLLALAVCAEDAGTRVSGSLSARTSTDSGPVVGLPKVTGPIGAVQAGDPSRNYPFDASLVPVSEYGYTENEYFFSGDTSAGSYTSRMLVRRPADPARFSGTVIVECANPMPGFDVDLLWTEAAADIMRSGDAFVLVTAQPEGVYSHDTGLKAWSPKRYAPLSMPQNSSSASQPGGSSAAELGSLQIFGQALEAIRSQAGVAPLDGLQVKRLIATGGSESAVWMTGYASQFGSLYGGADGYLIWDLSSASPLMHGDGPANAKTFPSPTGAGGPPVLWINTESDAARTHTTPDGPEYRLWEVAGTTHVDMDMFEYVADLEGRDFGGKSTFPNCKYPPLSRIPTGYALDAGIADLTAWIQTGTPPPSQPPLQYDAQGNVVRDAYGNAVGGVRLPAEAVPTAATGPENSGPGFCISAGHTIPFSADVLRDLYPTHADYAAKFNRAAQAAVAAGVMLPYDAQQAVNAASSANVPPAASVAPKSCAAKRAVWIRIPVTIRRQHVLRARITTPGHHPVSARGGRRVRLVVQRRTSDRVTVRIALRLRAGKRVLQVRTYQMCR